jgi:quercetin dioxygenase-like cupin family protein
MYDIQLEPLFVAAQTGSQQLRVITDVVTFKITGMETNGAYSLFETQTQPQTGVPPHTQVYEDEAFYILEGTYTFVIGERTVEATAGSFAFVPRGTVHGYTNSGDAPARMLIIVAPGGIHEQFFQEAGEPVSAPPSAPNFAKVGAAAAKYGIHILPPK